MKCQIYYSEFHPSRGAMHLKHVPCVHCQKLQKNGYKIHFCRFFSTTNCELISSFSTHHLNKIESITQDTSFTKKHSHYRTTLTHVSGPFNHMLVFHHFIFRILINSLIQHSISFPSLWGKDTLPYLSTTTNRQKRIHAVERALKAVA